MMGSTTRRLRSSAAAAGLRPAVLASVLVSVLALAASSPDAHAAFTGFQGKKAPGLGTWNQLGCVPAAASGPRGLGMVLALGPIGQAGKAPFTVKGRLADGTAFSGAGILQLAANGTFSLVTVPLDLKFLGPRVAKMTSFNGAIGPAGRASINASGADAPGPAGCPTISFTWTGSFGLDPSQSAPSVLLKRQRLDLAVRQLNRSLGRRLGMIFRRLRPAERGTPEPQRSDAGGDRSGLVASADGLFWSGEGLAAGDGYSLPFGVWGSAAYARSEDDFPSTAFDADRINLLAGADVSPSDRWVIGLAVGYEHSDTDTGFNAGGQRTDGITLAPYAAWLVTERLSLDVSLGYSRLRVDQSRTDPVTAATVVSDLNAERFMLSGNLTYRYARGPWQLTGQAGALWARSRDDAFVESDGTGVGESDNRLVQLRLGAEVAYAFEYLEPFARFTYEVDAESTADDIGASFTAPDATRNGGVVSAGVRYFSAGGISASAEYTGIVGRGDFTEHTVSVLLRAEF